MEILGIGAPELIFIIILALIILGPRDMEKAGRTIGKWLNQLVNSDGWRAFQRTSREIRNLPTNLMRQANLDELKETGRDIQNVIDPNRSRIRQSHTSGVTASKVDSSPTADRPSTSPPEDAPESDPANPPDDPERDA
jgi:sec-independent protein translocase protein TatB